MRLELPRLQRTVTLLMTNLQARIYARSEHSHNAQGVPLAQVCGAVPHISKDFYRRAAAGGLAGA